MQTYTILITKFTILIGTMKGTQTELTNCFKLWRMCKCTILSTHISGHQTNGRLLDVETVFPMYKNCCEVTPPQRKTRQRQ